MLLSIQLGRGRLWPGAAWRRVAALRICLLGLNCLALVMLPVVLNGLEHGKNAMLDAAYARAHTEQRQLDESRFGTGSAKAGLYADGKWVSNIYPYDAQGHPLVGVQLFNQIGQPINVVTQPEYIDDIDNPNEGRPRIFYPWTNGAAQVPNVFPIPSRVQEEESLSPTAFNESTPPTIGPFPLASVPAVALPGITPSRQRAH